MFLLRTHPKIVFRPQMKDAANKWIDGNIRIGCEYELTNGLKYFAGLSDVYTWTRPRFTAKLKFYSKQLNSSFATLTDFLETKKGEDIYDQTVGSMYRNVIEKNLEVKIIHTETGETKGWLTFNERDGLYSFDDQLLGNYSIKIRNKLYTNSADYKPSDQGNNLSPSSGTYSLSYDTVKTQLSDELKTDFESRKRDVQVDTFQTFYDTEGEVINYNFDFLTSLSWSINLWKSKRSNIIFMEPTSSYLQIPKWLDSGSNVKYVILVVEGVGPNKKYIIYKDQRITSSTNHRDFLKTNELDEVESWTNSQTKVAELCHNLIELRYELSVSISKLGRIYIWLTILGSFGIGLAIHFKKYDTTIISNIFIYIILQLIFLSIISIVGKNRQKLCDIIHTPGFSMKYILRDNNASETIENMITLENDTIITIKEIMSNKNIKIINCDNEIDNNDIELYETDMKETKKNSNIIKKMYNNVEQSGSSIDWLILNNILNNKWTHIDLFGISFDDGSGISKSIALTTTIIAMLNYIFNLFI